MVLLRYALQGNMKLETRNEKEPRIKKEKKNRYFAFVGRFSIFSDLQSYM